MMMTTVAAAAVHGYGVADGGDRGIQCTAAVSDVGAADIEAQSAADV